MPRSPQQADGEYQDLSITPASETRNGNYNKISNHILQPIVLAKKYFTLGEYLSSIAMSGIASEMMTLVVWNMSTIAFKGKALNKEEQTILFGKNFYKLNQDRKINILYLIKAIQENDRKMLDEIRKIRNKYIHSWDYNNRQDKGNAKKAIRNAYILDRSATLNKK